MKSSITNDAILIVYEKITKGHFALVYSFVYIFIISQNIQLDNEQMETIFFYWFLFSELSSTTMRESFTLKDQKSGEKNLRFNGL